MKSDRHSDDIKYDRLRSDDRRRVDDSGDTTGDDRLERSYFMSQASLQRSGHWLKSSVHVVLGPLYDYNEINAIQLCSIRIFIENKMRSGDRGTITSHTTQTTHGLA